MRLEQVVTAVSESIKGLLLSLFFFFSFSFT
jgi:hypothetical protein